MNEQVNEQTTNKLGWWIRGQEAGLLYTAATGYGYGSIVNISIAWYSTPLSVTLFIPCRLAAMTL